MAFIDNKEITQEQRSPEWYADRLGHLTASNANKVFARTAKGLKTAKYKDYVMQVVAERLTGASADFYVTADMQWGIDHEADAKERYEIETGLLISDVGFVKDKDIAYLGASPDGLVGADGLIEIKCPKSTTHLDRIASSEIPEEYRDQMLVQLIVTERKWCDFVDFDPRQKDKRLQIWIKRYEPTDEERQEAVVKVKEFLASVEETINRINSAIGE